MKSGLPLLVEVFWKSSAVLGVALCLTRLLRKKSADLRRFVLATAIVALFVAAAASQVLPRWIAVSTSWLPPTSPVGTTAASRIPVAILPPREAENQSSVRVAAMPEDISNSSAARMAEMIPLIWSAVTVVFLARLVIGLFGLRRLRKTSTLLRDLDSPTLDSPINVTLLENKTLATPVTWGIVRPVILVPACFRLLPMESREAIVHHELGHIEGRDFLIRVLAEVARAVIWFQPLMWIARRRLREEQELTCDNRVVAAGGKPSMYAKLLMDWEVQQPQGKAKLAVGMAQESCLKRRLYALLDQDLQRDMVSRARAVATWSFGVVTALGLATVGVTAAAPQNATHVEVARIAQATPKAAPPVALAPITAPIAFDAASIRPSVNSGEGGGRSGPAGGPRLEFTPGRVSSYLGSVTARRLIMEAYHLNRYQVSGGPGWLDSDSFDFEAKAADTSANEKQLRQMLQTLLAERFRLVVSRETREIPVYALVVAKEGAKLHEIKEDETEPATGKELEALGVLPPVRVGERIAGSMISRDTMDQFAEKLSDYPKLDRPVVDKTGIKGVYLIGLRWYADGDITTAMREWLGLRLESQKAPMNVLVIDHVVRPSEN